MLDDDLSYDDSDDEDDKATPESRINDLRKKTIEKLHETNGKKTRSTLNFVKTLVSKKKKRH